MRPLSKAAHTHKASGNAGPCSSTPSPTHHVQREGIRVPLETGNGVPPSKKEEQRGQPWGP